MIKAPKTLDEFKAMVIAAFPAFKDADFWGGRSMMTAHLGDGFIRYTESNKVRYRWCIGPIRLVESATLRGAAAKYRRVMAGTLVFVDAFKTGKRG